LSKHSSFLTLACPGPSCFPEFRIRIVLVGTEFFFGWTLWVFFWAFCRSFLSDPSTAGGSGQIFAWTWIPACEDFSSLLNRFPSHVIPFWTERDLFAWSTSPIECRSPLNCTLNKNLFFRATFFYACGYEGGRRKRDGHLPPDAASVSCYKGIGKCTPPPQIRIPCILEGSVIVSYRFHVALITACGCSAHRPSFSFVSITDQTVRKQLCYDFVAVVFLSFFLNGGFASARWRPVPCPLDFGPTKFKLKQFLLFVRDSVPLF